MGDVAMTMPVIHSLATQHPEIQITMLTRKHLAPLFQWMPANVECMGIDLKEYDGIGGLNRLYKELKALGFDAVADIHDVLRTKFLSMRFRLSGCRVAVIDKGRKDKKALIGHGMESDALMPMTERYRAVFDKLGYDFKLTFDRIRPDEAQLREFGSRGILPDAGDAPLIGIAPFAAHEGKIYPLDKMRRVAEMLAERGARVYLFGAGRQEKEILESWERDGIESVAGKLGGLTNELLLMSRLRLMISMDSSNMHMAAMMGTPTLSVWGATHPKAGFLAWGQTLDSVVQTELKCRPCSVYGNKPCQFGDYRCMNAITPEEIVNRVQL